METWKKILIGISSFIGAIVVIIAVVLLTNYMKNKNDTYCIP